MKNNNDKREKSYEILAEIYSEENELVRYIIINNKGVVMDVRANILEKWE